MGGRSFCGVDSGSIGIFLFILIGGLISEEIETRVVPNQGVWQSLRNALVIGLVVGFVFLGGFELYAGVVLDRISSSAERYIPE